MNQTEKLGVQVSLVNCSSGSKWGYNGSPENIGNPRESCLLMQAVNGQQTQRLLRSTAVHDNHPTMAVPFPSTTPKTMSKHRRRSATAVMAGTYDVRPARDVLTSLLNGVGPYTVVEENDEMRRIRKKEKKERDRERRRARALAKARDSTNRTDDRQASTPNASSGSVPLANPTKKSVSSFWAARPSIQLTNMQRSVSISPPPCSPNEHVYTPDSTPGPSNSSTVSASSSKRPWTPLDDEYFVLDPSGSPRPRKKKHVAVKKGWKGWVEGSPPPSEKLINLDLVPVLQDRRTRSGKNFDAIGVGKDGWV